LEDFYNLPYFKHQNEESSNASLLDGLSNFVGRIEGFGPENRNGFYQKLANVIRDKASYLKLSYLIDSVMFQKVYHLNSTGVYEGNVVNDILDEVEINSAGEITLKITYVFM